VNAVLIPHAVGFRIERVAPVTTADDAAATFSKYSNGTEGVELLVLRLKDGKILRMSVYNEGDG
jgi:hypothetical protein